MNTDKFLITRKSTNPVTGPIMVTTSPRVTCPLCCPLRKHGNGPAAGAWKNQRTPKGRTVVVCPTFTHPAEATVSQATAEVEKARQALGPKGASNPQIREAMAALRQAQLDLKRTTVYAPSDGGVTNLQLAVEQLLNKGQVAMTYIDVREAWIEAAFRENSLEHIKIGTPVSIVLDIRPGRVYSGRIKSIGYGVSSRSVDAATGLPSIRNQSGWIRSPQPMPVRIEFDEPRPPNLRVGSQATVMAFTGNNFVMNGIGSLRMWLNALFTYVY